jgi:uncharacterized tellurite resistance protein B-like protein
VFEALRKVLFESKSAKSGEPGIDNRQLAEAALMFHVIAADGVVSDDEQSSLMQRVSVRFGISAAQASQLMSAARAADSESVDLYRFTSVLKRELDYEARLGLISELWEMVFADGVVHEVEDTIVWRVAQMLDVETRDRMALKRKVRETKRDS